MLGTQLLFETWLLLAVLQLTNGKFFSLFQLPMVACQSVPYFMSYSMGKFICCLVL